MGVTMVLAFWPVILLGVLAAGYVVAGTTYVYQYEYGIRFRFGELLEEVDPGLRFQAPFVDTIRTYTRRVVTIEVPPQSTMTADNVALTASAVVYFRVNDPAQTIVSVQDHEYAVTQLAQSTLRSTIGATELDEVLGNRQGLAEEIESTVDEIAHDWGIDVVAVELRELEVPDKLQRVIAAQAEAERERRARSTLAEAEQEAAEELVAAADTLEDHPEAMRLRQFQNLKEVAAESNSNVVVPVPSDLFSFLEDVGLPDFLSGTGEQPAADSASGYAGTGSAAQSEGEAAADNDGTDTVGQGTGENNDEQTDAANSDEQGDTAKSDEQQEAENSDGQGTAEDSDEGESSSVGWRYRPDPDAES